MENLNNLSNLENYDLKLTRDFFMTDGVDLAQKLLGKTIVRKIDNSWVKVKILETEAYMGPDDKAAHCYNNKKTERTKYFWQEGGCLYVYGIHQSLCLNIVANTSDKPEAILIRAVEPISGIDKIKQLRKDIKSSTKKQILNLTNGPGKVGASLKISLKDNALDLCTSEEFFLEDNPHEEIEIEKSTRININYAQEYRFKPWRFYIKSNPYVSKAKVEHKFID